MATVVFLAAAAFCLYTVFGYPLLLAALAVRRRAWHKEFQARTVSVLLPVRNGEPWIGAKLETLLALDYPAELLEIIVLSDGSTDRTAEIAAGYCGRRNIRVVELPPGGKAAALNAGLKMAHGEILFLTDVRQALGRDSLRHLVACFADPRVGAASGELIIREGDSSDEASTGLYWRYEKWIRKRQSRVDSVPGATGCVYAMRRELARPLPAETLADDMYLPLGALLGGYRVVLDESAKAFDYPTSLKTEFRRKVRTLAGVYQIVRFYPALLGPRNRIWLHFMSHKVARLFLPWALLIAAVSSIWMPAPWRWAAMAAQLGFYAFAALDPLLAEKSRFKRISATVRAFVVLMAAALFAVTIIFFPARKLWHK